MTHLALVMRVCAYLGVRDPMEFYTTFPAHLQTLWIEHVACEFSGAYERAPRRSGGGARALEQELIDRGADTP